MLDRHQYSGGQNKRPIHHGIIVVGGGLHLFRSLLFYDSYPIKPHSIALPIVDEYIRELNNIFMQICCIEISIFETPIIKNSPLMVLLPINQGSKYKGAAGKFVLGEGGQ